MPLLKNKKKCIWTMVLLAGSILSHAQFTQRIRGSVVDQVLQKPVAGASVSLLSINKTVTTDSTGSFRFANVPVGNQQIIVSHIGFKDAFLENIVVVAGKDLY
jgi:hypothetical protein